ncbi:MAG: polysaccharide deacetylase family protein [Verrucomicrobia bacterium]|nr:polysaccharide deacetylase family protein [Verrucomicrobiota bacterium]
MNAASVLPPRYFNFAPFRGAAGHGALALMYHQLLRPRRDSPLRGLCVAPELFRRQLAELRAAGLTAVSPADAYAEKANSRVVITFDDGFANVLTGAVGTLRENNFTAINYLVADRLGKTNDWDAPLGEPPAPLMDVAQVRDWLAACQSIGAHTLTHPHLTRIPLAQARAEIFDAKKKLEDQFGVAIEHFCYPYGGFNETIRGFVIEAGYRTACGTAPGIVNADADRFSFPRFLASHRRPGAAAWLPFVPARWL